MQVTHDFDTATALPVGWGVQVLLLTSAADNALEQRVLGLGGLVEVETEMYAALAALIDDPMGYGLFVMDCDSFGGPEAGAQAAATLMAARSRVPMILISKDHSTQVFPQERELPTCLRAPLSAVSLRVGFEHALRERLLWRVA